MEDRSFKILSKTIQALNKHIARERRTLEDLLREEKPRVVLRDGSAHVFKKEELEKISGLLPEAMKKTLRLPIYIELSPDRFGSGTARVAGQAECRVVAKILGMDEAGDELFLYRYDMGRLRRELPTTTQYIFTA